jgi:hypothetical protein
VKKVENKIVYFKETMECLHLIFSARIQRRVHCHTAELDLNQRITMQWVAFLMNLIEFYIIMLEFNGF